MAKVARKKAKRAATQQQRWMRAYSAAKRRGVVGQIIGRLGGGGAHKKKKKSKRSKKSKKSKRH